MKYFNLILLLIFIATATAVHSKPLPSLSVKIQWQDELVQGESLKMNLSVFSHVSSDNLEVKLTLPEGVILLDGEKQFMTSIEHAVPFQQSYIVQVNKGAEGMIKAEATIKSGSKSEFHAISGLSVQPQTNQKLSPKAAKKENFKRIQRNGEWVREYQLP